MADSIFYSKNYFYIYLINSKKTIDNLTLTLYNDLRLKQRQTMPEGIKMDNRLRRLLAEIELMLHWCNESKEMYVKYHCVVEHKIRLACQYQRAIARKGIK